MKKNKKAYKFLLVLTLLIGIGFIGTQSVTKIQASEISVGTSISIPKSVQVDINSLGVGNIGDIATFTDYSGGVIASGIVGPVYEDNYVTIPAGTSALFNGYAMNGTATAIIYVTTKSPKTGVVSGPRALQMNFESTTK
ncbi:hypothetical protein EFE32_08065 [Lactococcus lactis subsp. lactis]|uniref:hypothetical protein n=1 Tax=Lactococcus lactis TaxID=1358 RepID=UPI00223B3B3C|nr:hypothetical protein [Lactococcus lactis]MCT0016795.1 hypothetical protein [Lactococcus lactis subsp. lactis]